MLPWESDPPLARGWLQDLWRHTDDWVSGTKEADLLCNLFATVALNADLSIQRHSMCGRLLHFLQSYYFTSK